jgi:tRNA dimethylallyltransferase
MKNALPKLLVIVGPTASGKTDLSLALAREFGGEIISCDSRQFYRGLEIGAGTVPGEWGTGVAGQAWIAEGVPHYFINVIDPDQQLTVAEYQEQAVAKARAIAAGGRLPMLVGGSMLYASAVIDNYQMPEVLADEAYRAELAAWPLEKLMAELTAKDPAYAARAGQNARYIIRALECMRATGRAMTELQQKGAPLFDVLQLGVTRPKEELHARINQRFDAMLQAGLLEETARLAERYGWDCPAFVSLGHRQLAAHLRGQAPLATAVEEAKRATRAYAKRQLTWFKRDQRIQWVSTAADAESAVKAWLLTSATKSLR